jgi:uncharacterized protein YkwD
MKSTASPIAALWRGAIFIFSFAVCASTCFAFQNKDAAKNVQTKKPESVHTTAANQPRKQTFPEAAKPMMNADFLSPMEREMIAEINLARTEPQKYAAFLEEMRPFFKGNDFTRPKQKTVTTNEGVKGVEDAINFLKAAKAVSRLEIQKGMFLAAKDHVGDLIATRQFGHKGSDGNFVDARVSRYGSWSSSIGETIAYGGATPREIVINFIIDDGNPKRGHRLQLFDPSCRVIGVSCGKHPLFETLCVVTFTGDFSEKKTTDDAAKTSPPKAVKK